MGHMPLPNSREGRMKQLKLNIYKGTHGGRRPGSGRKRLHSEGVAHRRREKVTHRTPVHINFKVKTQVRNKRCLKILKRAILNARRQGLRIIHFALESNHVHLIIEAIDNAVLTRGMRSLTVTFSKNVNKGRIQLERYHLHVLRSRREARNAVNYVVLNHEKHLNLKRAYVPGPREEAYSSLGLVKDLKTLAREKRIEIIKRGIQVLNFLDLPRSWMMKNLKT